FLEKPVPLVLAHGVAVGGVIGDGFHAPVAELAHFCTILIVDRPETGRFAVGEQHVRLDDLAAVLAHFLPQHLDRGLQIAEFLIYDRLVCGKRERWSEERAERASAQVGKNSHVDSPWTRARRTVHTSAARAVGFTSMTRAGT